MEPQRKLFAHAAALDIDVAAHSVSLCFGRGRMAG
jgi:hypothetical protein